MRTPPYSGENNEYLGFTHRAVIKGRNSEQVFYILTHEDQNGVPRGLEIVLDKQGGALRVYSQFARAVTEGLQHGVPLRRWCEMFLHVLLEPNGYTGHEKIRHADSIIDYTFKWLWLRYIDEEPPWLGGEVEK